MDSTKTTQLQIRVTPDEKAAIRAAAKRSGMTMSEWVVRRLLPPIARRFTDLVSRLELEIDPALWAELIEVLQELEPDAFEGVVEEVDPGSLDPYRANYLAALIELAATRKQRPPPPWVREVKPLTRPVFGSGLRTLRAHLLLHAPLPFRRRNIFIDAAVGDRV